jgi:hypothetical protein
MSRTDRPLDAPVEGRAARAEDVARPVTGSPRRWLALVGILTPHEAAMLRISLRDFESVEEAD